MALVCDMRVASEIDLENHRTLYRKLVDRLLPVWRAPESFCKAVQGFASEYGCLGTKSAFDGFPVWPTQAEGQVEDLPEADGGPGWIALELVDDWNELACQIAGALDLIDAHNNSDLKTVRECILVRGNGFVTYRLKSGCHTHFETLQVRVNRTQVPWYDLARLAISDYLNKQLGKSLKYQVVPSSGGVEGKLVPVNMQGFLWHQVALEAFGARRTKQCRTCGNWFVASWRPEEAQGRKSHSKYCSDGCRHAYWNARKATTRDGRKPK